MAVPTPPQDVLNYQKGKDSRYTKYLDEAERQRQEAERLKQEKELREAAEQARKDAERDAERKAERDRIEAEEEAERQRQEAEDRRLAQLRKKFLAYGNWWAWPIGATFFILTLFPLILIGDSLRNAEPTMPNIKEPDSKFYLDWDFNENGSLLDDKGVFIADANTKKADWDWDALDAQIKRDWAAYWEQEDLAKTAYYNEIKTLKVNRGIHLFAAIAITPLTAILIFLCQTYRESVLRKVWAHRDEEKTEDEQRVLDQQREEFFKHHKVKACIRVARRFFIPFALIVGALRWYYVPEFHWYDALLIAFWVWLSLSIHIRPCSYFFCVMARHIYWANTQYEIVNYYAQIVPPDPDKNV